VSDKGTNEQATEFVREPAFQLGRFKKALHGDFNDEFADDLLAVLGRVKHGGALADFQAKLTKVRKANHAVVGPPETGEGFQVCRFQRNLTVDFTEGFSGDLLTYLGTQDKLTKYVYAFRQKLDNRLNDNFVPGVPYVERRAV
jgi:hypothetical protein